MTNQLFLLNSPELWKAVAFFISTIVIILPVYKLLIKAVQVRSNKIAEQIEEALKLKREAKEILKATQHKMFYKNNEQNKIIQSALKDAKTLKQEADSDLDALMLRREKEKEERICLIREKGLKELKNNVLDFAIDTTQSVLTESDKKLLMKTDLNDLENILTNPAQIEYLKKQLI